MKYSRILASLSVAVLLVGCSSDEKKSTAMKKAPTAVAVATLMPSGAAATMPSNRNVHGTVTFTQWGDVVEVYARVEGLQPGTEHGFHIHEKGDLSSPDLMSTGGHWDPGMAHHHGAPMDMGVHAGDLGNLKADSDGVATIRMKTKAFSLTGSPSAIGHAVIVHGKVDDLTSQPAGNAGARVAGGVIQIK